MDDTHALTIVDSDPHAIGDVLPPSALDLAIAAWLDAKYKHTQSERTRHAYRGLLAQFRMALQRAGLQWRHVKICRNVVTLFFERCKGNKSAHVELSKEASSALLRWLHLHYGRDLARLSAESPLWMSLARNESYGHQLSIQAIGQICLKRLGTSKVHTMRHTFTMGMLESGASVHEVSSKLLHSSLQTTTLYVDKLQSAKNERAGKLAQLFGFK